MDILIIQSHIFFEKDPDDRELGQFSGKFVKTKAIDGIQREPAEKTPPHE
jgi:hypothetical protein